MILVYILKIYNFISFKFYIFLYVEYLSSFKLIARWFIFNCLENFITNFYKKIFIKSGYLVDIVTLLTINKTIKAYLAKYIHIFVFKQVICIINTFYLSLKLLL